jgi:hypothetical protein
VYIGDGRTVGAGVPVGMGLGVGVVATWPVGVVLGDGELHPQTRPVAIRVIPSQRVTFWMKIMHSFRDQTDLADDLARLSFDSML